MRKKCTRGEFRWSGFDYLGECYGWPAKSWNFGIIDLCGFPKDAYYFLQSQWTDKPMVHILPHWTWPGLEDKTIPVIAYSNCDRVELFLNDISLGVREMDDVKMYARWDVRYRPGTLKVVAYRGDTLAATMQHETAGTPAALRITPEEESIRADGTSIAHVKIEVVDEHGRMVPHANHDVKVFVDGPARLIGMENGDPIDTTNYKLDHRRAFNGMLLAILQSDATSGTITITATSGDLKSSTQSVQAV